VLLALPASRGGLAIMGNMTAAKTIKTPTTVLKDLLAINQVGHRGATQTDEAVDSSKTEDQFFSLGNQRTGWKQYDVASFGFGGQVVGSLSLWQSVPPQM